MKKEKLLTSLAAASMVLTQAGQMSVFAKGATADGTDINSMPANKEESKIENGENSLSKGNLLAICRQFNVNKEWLINGNGEMFTPKSKEDEIRNFFENAISSDSDIAKIQRKFISTLVSLDEEEWIVLDRFMKHYIYSK